MARPILIIDDEASYRDILATLLSRAGYRIVESEDGADCLEIARKTDPACILLDVLPPAPYKEPATALF